MAVVRAMAAACAFVVVAPIGHAAQAPGTPAAVPENRAEGATTADAGTDADADRNEVAPTPTDALVEAALRAARVGRRDVVFDLGSGDGRLPIIAAVRFGAMGVGVEFDGDVVAIARRRAEAERIVDRTEYRQADPFSADLSKATVIAFHQPPSHNVKLRPKFLELKPGTRVIGLQFDMGDWVADERVATEPNQNAYLWIVPSSVAGTWRVRLSEGRAPREFNLHVAQHYQRIEGELRAPGVPAEPVRLGMLRGDRVTFLVPGEVDRSFFAQVVGDVMSGTVSDGVRAIRFRADRIAR